MTDRCRKIAAVSLLAIAGCRHGYAPPPGPVAVSDEPPLQVEVLRPAAPALAPRGSDVHISGGFVGRPPTGRRAFARPGAVQLVPELVEP